MIIKAGMTLLCSYYMYAPGMGKIGKVEIKDVITIVNYKEDTHVFVSYIFTDNSNINYLGETKNQKKYELVDEVDLQGLCKEKK